MNKHDIVPMIIILIIASAIFILFLGKRPFTDEGSFCTIAQAISKGAILYRDIYNEKAPLPYFIASIFINTGENPIVVLRTISFFFFLLTIFLIYLIGKANLLQPIESMSLTLFYGITVPLFQSFNYTAEIISLPLVLFILWQIRRDSNDKINLLTGFFTGLLIFIKQPFVPFVLITIVFALFSKNLRKNFFIGLLISLLLTLFLLKLKGTLMPFIENNIFTINQYNIKSYMRFPYPNEYYQFILLGSLLIATIYFFIKRIVSIYEFLSIFCLLTMGMVRMDAFKMLPLFTTFIFVFTRKDTFSLIKNKFLITIFLSILSIRQYGEISNQDFEQIKAISYTIETKTTQNDSIWVGPHEANIYCISKRRPASKYFFILPWINRPEVLSVLNEDLINNDPPRCIIDVSKFNNATEYNLKDMLPILLKLLENYKDVQEINGAIIYCKD